MTMVFQSPRVGHDMVSQSLRVDTTMLLGRDRYIIFSLVVIYLFVVFIYLSSQLLTYLFVEM